MIQLSTIQLIALCSLAFIGFLHLISWGFSQLQTFMRPHVFIMELNEENQELRSMLRTTMRYVPTTTSDGAQLHNEANDLLDESNN